MENTENRNNAYLMLKLIAVTINAQKSTDFILHLSESKRTELVEFACKHSLSAITSAALQNAGFRDTSIMQQYSHAVRKSVLFEHEYQIISQDLADHHIHFLPLKGIRLKELYPKSWMREMSDIDILIEHGSHDTVKAIAEGNGYMTYRYGKDNEDVYRKKPFFVLEMHRSLFNSDLQPKLHSYFEDKKYRCSDEYPYLWQMDLTENYIYLIAHLYLHYSTSGTGLRSLLDIHLFLRTHHNAIDFSAVRRETAKFGANTFEERIRHLAQVFLEPDTCSAEDKADLDYFISSGTYGTKRQFFRNRINESVDDSALSKIRYIKSRFTVSDKELHNHPFYSKHPRLKPIMKIPRLFKAVIKKPKTIALEMKELINH